MADTENLNEIDPIQELEQAKIEIKKKISAQKTTIQYEKKELTRLRNLPLEFNPNKPTLVKDQEEKINLMNGNLTELEHDLKNLDKTRDDENEEKIQAALHQLKTKWLDVMTNSSYIIQDEEYIHIDDYSTDRRDQNVQIRKYKPKQFSEFLSKTLKVPSWHLPEIRVKDLYHKNNRTFEMVRYSISNHKWKKDNVYLPISHMENYFVNNFNLTETEQNEKYSDFFDVLLHSLSGGKVENKEHLEKWILHKIKNYKKAVTTPDLVIVGHVGGNGKGILQAMIRNMMPATLSGKANAKTLNGNFNAIMEGKLVVFFDDQNSKEIPLEVVKQLAGSDTMIYEPKGKDQYEGEKTHSSAWFSNVLPFRLTPGGQEGGVDRRFSVMRTVITFLESIREYYKNICNEEITVEYSKDMAEIIVRDILLNRVEIAKWFKHLEKKYPEINENYTLKPLHGEDYYYFLEEQQTSMELIWDKLVTPVIKNGGCVPVFVVNKLLEYLDDGKTIGNKRLGSKIKELINTTKLDVVIERMMLDIQPNVTNKLKQCRIIRPRKDGEFVDRQFNWNLVSNRPFNDLLGINEKMFNEDNCVFGQTNVVDDDDEEDVIDLVNSPM